MSKLAQSLRHVLAGAKGRDIVQGSIEQGLGAVRSHHLVLCIVVATAVVGAVALVAGIRARVPGGLTGVEPDGNAPRARGQLLLLGVALLIVPWAPFVAQNARDFELRSLYVPLIGVAILVAAVGNGVCRWVAMLGDRGGVASRVSVAVAVGLAAIAGQIGLVGVQTQFRTASRQDAVVAAQLAAMSAHVEPNTTFMILAAEHRGAATSREVYNKVLHTALRDPWCAMAFLRRSMRRSDVRLVSGSYGLRAPLPIDHLSSESVRYTGAGGKRRSISWESVVPLWIDSNAGVHIVEALSLQPPGRASLEVRPPRAERLAHAVSGAAAASTTVGPMHVVLIETPGGRSRVVVDWGSAHGVDGTNGHGR